MANTGEFIEGACLLLLFSLTVTSMVHYARSLYMELEIPPGCRLN